MSAFTPEEQREFLASLGIAETVEDAPEAQDTVEVSQVVVAPSGLPDVDGLMFDPKWVAGLDMDVAEDRETVYRIIHTKFRASNFGVRPRTDASRDHNRKLKNRAYAWMDEFRKKPQGVVKAKVKAHAEGKNERTVEAVLELLFEKAEEKGVDLAGLFTDG